MTTNSAWIRVDPERIIDALKHEAVDQVETGQRVVLDFSSVSRVDAGSLKAL